MNSLSRCTYSMLMYTTADWLKYSQWSFLPGYLWCDTVRESDLNKHFRNMDFVKSEIIKKTIKATTQETTLSRGGRFFRKRGTPRLPKLYGRYIIRITNNTFLHVKNRE